jgi:hypothetical protein
MVNKKGILRIIEASIAILIILTVVLSLSLARRASVERDLSAQISPLLEEIAKNNSMRDEIISNPNANATIMAFLADRIKESNLDYSVRICEMDAVCGLEIYPSGISGNIYAGSRIISSSLMGGAKPKRISLFLWIKE